MTLSSVQFANVVLARCVSDASHLSVGYLLALTDSEMEGVDVVAANVVVARGIPNQHDLDVVHYCNLVDRWTDAFAAGLPRMGQAFQRTPERWKGDIRFFRVGMLAGFLGHEIGIRYSDQHKDISHVKYHDPSDLFLHGLIDTKRGTCANMALLHVAMARRMGWPVSLACAGSHLISRFDDGEVVHNIELSSVTGGTFASDPDEFYLRRFRLPLRAVQCGSDLRRLTAREMLGVMLSIRARHFADTERLADADRDYALSRALFPTYRHGYLAALEIMGRVRSGLFDPDEGV